MPIGTTAAIIGAGVLGAGASVAAASKNSSAINNSTDASLQANREAIAAQERAFQQSLQFQQNALNQTQQQQQTMYNTNYGMLSPFAQNGLYASNNINALLGLETTNGTIPSAPPFQPAPAAPTPAQGAPQTQTLPDGTVLEMGPNGYQPVSTGNYGSQAPGQGSGTTAPPMMGDGYMPWVY